MNRVGLFVGGLTAAVGLLAGCSSSGGDSSGVRTADAPEATTTTTAGPPFPVATETVTLVDPSRPTPASEQAGVAASDERTLQTTITYPDAPGRFPLIAFAHGLSGHPRKFTELHAAWAEAGYVVVAPAFPLSNDTVPGEPDFADLPNQPGDISFTIDEALRLNDEAGSALAGRIDPDRVGAAGLSLGGGTTYGVAFNDCCLDDRVDAAIVMDGARFAVGGEFDLGNGTPLLIYHADRDPSLPYADSEEAYALAAPPKYFVTIHEAVHASPFENDPDPADEVVTASSIAFWDRHLAELEDRAPETIVAAATSDGLTTVASDPG